MYRPAAFREDRPEVMLALIAAHPLGLLITAGPAGLMASPVPFLIDRAEGAYGTLRCHLARANPQVAELAAVGDCLVVFQGPQDYVSPGWYPSKRAHGRVVPTWNYVTVHAWGAPRVVPDAAWLHAQVGALTDAREAGRPAPWAVDDAPADFVAGQLRAITGIEIPVARMEGKWKVSQNRDAADRAGVAEGLRAEGHAAMADLVTTRSPK